MVVLVMPKVIVPQKNLTLETTVGKNLMDLLIEHQIPVASSCQGDGICSKCAVKMIPVGNPSEAEIMTLKRNNLDSSYRLSCQYKITTDISIQTGYW